MRPPAEMPSELRRYLDRLVERLASVVELDAVYLLGSAALGAWDPETSDVDVVAVTARSLDAEERRALARTVESLPTPGRKLELVVYPRGRAEWEVNLNTGDHVSFDPAEEPRFWFVVDRSIAEQHAIPLVGPPWGERFEPVPREAVLGALAESLDWIEREEPAARASVLNTCRSLAWLRTGRWMSKPDAAAWLRALVRTELEAAR